MYHFQILILKRLEPNICEAKLLGKYLEKGVFEALELKYLDTLIFTINSNLTHEALEVYKFHVQYNDKEDGDEYSVSIEKDGKEIKPLSKDDVKNQIALTIRSLVALTQTLDPLPKGRYLSLSILYRDEYTPTDYEPKYFRKADNMEDKNYFTKDPVKFRIGKVNTNHHQLALKLHTTADSFNKNLSSTTDTNNISDSQKLHNIFDMDTDIEDENEKDKENNNSNNNISDEGNDNELSNKKFIEKNLDNNSSNEMKINDSNNNDDTIGATSLIAHSSGDLSNTNDNNELLNSELLNVNNISNKI